MWGRIREPGDYCVAHAPNVYANLPGCVVCLRVLMLVMSHVIPDVARNARVHGYATREESFLDYIFYYIAMAAKILLCRLYVC